MKTADLKIQYMTSVNTVIVSFNGESINLPIEVYHLMLEHGIELKKKWDCQWN